MTITVFNTFLEKLLNGDSELDTLALRVALFTNAYTPAKTDLTYTAIAGANEVSASGTNYTTGGALLTGVTVGELVGQDAWSMNADDVSWTASTITARVIVVYEDVSKDLVTAFKLDTDVISTNGLWEIQWHEDGVVKVSQQVA